MNIDMPMEEMLFPPISEEELAAFEQAYQIHLPAEYRDFLLRYNGGMPKRRIFDIDMDGFPNSIPIQLFSGVSQTHPLGLQATMATFVGRMPANLIPIANDSFGNPICLSVSGEDTGYVYFWDRDMEQEEPDYSNVYFIAKSFNAFLDLLCTDEEYHRD